MVMVLSNFVLILYFFILFFATWSNSGEDTVCIKVKKSEVFIERIFRKYGTAKVDKSVVIYKPEFNRLLKALALGSVTIKCQKNDTDCIENKNDGHMFGTTESTSRVRRHSGDGSPKLSKNQKREHNKHWRDHFLKCMKPGSIFSLYGINESFGITKNDFLRVCPSLVQQIDENVCEHLHKKPPSYVPMGPSSAETWGYGFLAITVVSLLSLCVIALIPCLNKSFYNYLMAFLVALAVGTLAGDAMLHLIPHAFIEGANSAAEIYVTQEQRLKQHYSQVWRALFVLLGVYMFFLVEQLMKLKDACCGKEHSKSAQKVPLEETAGGTEGNEDHEMKEEEHHHGHGHGEKNINKETKVASVAWMVIVGDGFHNFSDGLAVGAAFSASLSSGLSTAIAVFCHELPHELGDFAILIKSGMTVKQAIVYNLVSAVLAYVGMAVGILAGTGEFGRHVILSITAGLFLYISLADMLAELTEQEHSVKSRVSVFLCQHLGLLTGAGVMLFISLYEHNM